MAHHDVHDLRCIIGVRNRDRRAIEALYDRHTPLVYSLALRILEDPREAEDAVKETWVEVWTRAGQYDPRRAPVGAWVLTIARARALNARCSGSARRSAVARAPASESPPRAASSATPSEDAPPDEASQPPPSDVPPASNVPPVSNGIPNCRHRRLHARVAAAFAHLTEPQRAVLTTAFFGGKTQREIAGELDVSLATVKTLTRQGLMRLEAILPGRDRS